MGWKHGLIKTSEYFAWSGMRERCFNKNNQSYERYGGRGITVCERWQGRDGFTNFLADMGQKPTPGHTIERRDNNGNYEPGNVRWATRKEQARNTRRNRLITSGGETKCLHEWAEVSGINPFTILRRLKVGWPVELAISKKARGNGRRRLLRVEKVEPCQTCVEGVR